MAHCIESRVSVKICKVIKAPLWLRWEEDRTKSIFFFVGCQCCWATTHSGSLFFFFYFSLVSFFFVVEDMSTVVIVGDLICGGKNEGKLLSSDNDIFLRGYNTISNCEGTDEIVAAVCGTVEVTEKVVSVKGLFSRYVPEIGDVVVGRVLDVVGNKWTVDVNCSQSAVMLLSNVSEPGGVLRRRGRSDELTMRQLFDQGDLIAAEVQRISPDGVPFLQVRSGEKYGRISSVGKLVTVKSSLMKRSNQHFISLPQYSSNLLLGSNGNIWVSEGGQPEDRGESQQSVARVANCVRALGANGEVISHQNIMEAVEASLSAGINCSDILLESSRSSLFPNSTKRSSFKRPRD